jgi:DNA-binding CsgD family transcriptional regulator
LERLNGRDLRNLLTFSQGLLSLHSPEEFLDYTLPRIATLVSSEFSSFGDIDPSRPPSQMGRTWTRPFGLNPPGYTDWSQSLFAAEPTWLHFQQTRESLALRHSDFYSERQYRDTEHYALYNEMARPIRDMMVVIKATPSGCLHNFGSTRGKRFSERDRLVFDAIAPHIFQAYSNANAFSTISRHVVQLDSALENRNRAVVLLALDLHVTYVSDRAIAWITNHFGGFVADKLPDRIDLWLRRQLSAMRPKDDMAPAPEPMYARVAGGTICIRYTAVPEGWLLLLELKPDQPDTVALEALGITKREAEVLAYVALGKTSRDIADILSVGLRTIEKHLEHIFEHLGVENRTAAAAIALERWNADLRFGR